jgi:ribosomal protein L10
MNKWKKTRLGDVILTNTSSYSSKEGWEFVNYLDTGNITKNIVDKIQRIDLNTEKLPSRAKRKVKYNSILYSTVRPNQHHYGVIKEHLENFLVSTGFTVIDVDEVEVDADFLYYLLSQDRIIERLHSIAEQSVSAYPSIKSADIENIEVELPPLTEQKKIASVLCALSSRIQKNTEINNNLEQQAQAIFINEFISLKMPPDGWKQASLIDIADYLNGLAMQKYRPTDDEIGISVLKIKELRQGCCDNNSELCSPNIKSEYIIHDGDVIFSWSGSLLVDFWCGGICGLNQHLFKVTSSKYDKWFYYAWTKHHLDRFISVAADKATTMGHIKRDELAKAEVFIPNESDYSRIGALLQPIYDLIISNRIENEKLALIRDTLLPKLMFGELDVSNIDF